MGRGSIASPALQCGGISLQKGKTVTSVPLAHSFVRIFSFCKFEGFIKLSILVAPTCTAGFFQNPFRRKVSHTKRKNEQKSGKANNKCLFSPSTLLIL